MGTEWIFAPRETSQHAERAGQRVSILRAPNLEAKNPSVRVQFPDGHALTVGQAQLTHVPRNVWGRTTPYPERDHTPVERELVPLSVIARHTPDPAAPVVTRRQKTQSEILFTVIVYQLADKITQGLWEPLVMPNATYGRPGESRGYPDRGQIRISVRTTVMTDSRVLTIGCQRDITTAQYRVAFFNLEPQDKVALRQYFQDLDPNATAMRAWENLARLLLLGVSLLAEKPRVKPLVILVAPDIDEEECVPVEQLAPAYSGRARRVRPVT